MEEVLAIKDLDTLKIISDPFRIDLIKRIGAINLAGELSTVKELAEKLDLPPTKLYYHINLLEKHGIIKVAETQVVSGIIEKKYMVAAKRITLDEDLVKSDEIPTEEHYEAAFTSIKAILDSALDDLRKSFDAAHSRQPEDPENNRPPLYSSNSSFLLTREQNKTYQEELTALVERFDDISNKNNEDKNADAVLYNFTVLLNPSYHLKNPFQE